MFMSFMFCPVASLCHTLRELQINLSFLHKENPSCLLDTELFRTIYCSYQFSVVKCPCLAGTLQYTPKDQYIIQMFAIWFLQTLELSRQIVKVLDILTSELMF